MKVLASDGRLQCLSGAGLQLACVTVGDETGTVFGIKKFGSLSFLHCFTLVSGCFHPSSEHCYDCDSVTQSLLVFR